MDEFFCGGVGKENLRVPIDEEEGVIDGFQELVTVCGNFTLRFGEIIFQFDSFLRMFLVLADP